MLVVTAPIDATTVCTDSSAINKIVTNLQEPGEPKDPDNSTVFQVWEAFATREQSEYMRGRFAEGIGWGDAKKELFELINTELEEPRRRYHELMDDGAHIEAVLLKGAERAREQSSALIAKVRAAVGISPIS